MFIIKEYSLTAFASSVVTEDEKILEEIKQLQKTIKSIERLHKELAGSAPIGASQAEVL